MQILGKSMSNLHRHIISFTLFSLIIVCGSPFDKEYICIQFHLTKNRNVFNFMQTNGPKKYRSLGTWSKDSKGAIIESSLFVMFAWVSSPTVRSPEAPSMDLLFGCFNPWILENNRVFFIIYHCKF